MSRRRAAWLILGLWAVGLVWLARREAGGKRPDIVLNVNPAGTFLSLRLGEAQMGVTSFTVDTLGADVTTQEFLQLDFPAGDTVWRVLSRTTATLTRALRLRSFESITSGDLDRQVARGVVDGDTALRLTVVAGRDSTTTRVTIAPAVTLPSLVPLTAALRAGREEADTFRLSVLDLGLLAPVEVHVTVGPESTFVVPDSAVFDSSAGRWTPARWDTVAARRLALRGAIVPAIIWVDANGAVVQAVTRAGVVARREAFTLAYENYRRATEAGRTPGGWSPALRLFSPPPASSPSPTPAAPLDSAQLVIEGVDPANFPDLEGGSQVRRGDTLVVRPRHRVSGAAAPDSLAWSRSPILQPRDPRIAVLARQLRASTRGGWSAVRALVDWVHGHIPEGGGGFATAPQVLEARRGDVNGRAALLVALVLASGVPARPVTGLMVDGGAMYYHAWAEVWLDGWVPVDPTLGQAPADARHVRLAANRFARPADLIHIVGGIRLRTP